MEPEKEQRIDPSRPEELTLWAEKFGVKPEEIAAAIKVVGSKVGDVRRKLAQNRSY